MKRGFTLIEMLVAVLIIAILSGVAIPNYMRSVEKTRSTEAMQMIKSLNDAVYGYSSERNTCPEKFTKLLVDVPGKNLNAAGNEYHSNGFTYYLGGATHSPIPGTPGCGGLLAVRDHREYKLWNPYRTINENTKVRTIACTGSTPQAIKLCEGFGIYTTLEP